MKPGTKYWRFKKDTLDKLAAALVDADHLDVRVDVENQMWLAAKSSDGTVIAEMDDSFPCPPFC